jgi:cell wall assembly regulator SMI1
MTKINIILSEKEVNDVDIKNFENNFNISLPNNFITHIKKYNGGLIKDSDDIRKLLPLKYGSLNIEELIDTHQITEQNIPEGYLPIALDYSSNPITINLNEGENYGKIVIFELDFEGEGFVIANSLEELLGVESIDDL